MRLRFLNGGRVGESVDHEVEDEESAGEEDVGITEAEPGGWHCEVGSEMEGLKWMESLALSEGIFRLFQPYERRILRVVGFV